MGVAGGYKGSGRDEPSAPLWSPSPCAAPAFGLARMTPSKVGSFLDISIGKGRGVVEVCYIERSHEPSVAYYGVQFFELDSQLRDLVLDLTRSDRGPFDT